MPPKDKRHATGKAKECIECDPCVMLSVNSGEHVLSGGLLVSGYPPSGFTTNPYKETQSWEGGILPARPALAAAALPEYVRFSY